MTTRTATPMRPGTSWRGMLLSGAALTLALGSTAGAQEAPAPAKKPAATEVVTVTAQRRVQNLQDVPISVQVLGGAALKRLNVENFDDLIGQLPNVTAAGFGPGQDNIYIRGLSIGGLGSQGNGGVGSFPNVAVYLDDQSAQVPGRNLDIYAVDLQQVEVLEGPQGTLFGSGAQAGVVRYITNKPDLEKFGGTIDVGGAETAHGAPSGNIDATVNIPLVKDKLAVRISGYDDKRGGYIDNVPGTFVRQSTDHGIHYAGYTNNIPGPPNSTNSINNFGLAKNNINPVTYEGFRAEAELKFNEDWNALLTESEQRMYAAGVFYEEPYTSGKNPTKLPDLSVQTFEPSFDEDQFENTALTINGRLGELNLVYSGAYLVRHVSQQQDYTNYARGVYADYYQCHNAQARGFTKPQCYSPGATWQDHEQDDHLSQEARISTPDTWRLRGIGGFYYEDFQVKNQVDYNYLTAPGFVEVGPPPDSTASNPNPRGPNTAFFNDITRGYRQYALFGSADFDIIPKVLTVTFGTRWFDFYNYEKGSDASSFGCGPGPYAYYSGPPPCLADVKNLDAKNLQGRSYGFKSRANVTYKITPDIMVYYTWSQGYRPPGYNRSAPAAGGFLGNIGYTSDTLTNNEIGYKATFLDHRLILDGAIYQENWNNVQTTLFDPGVFGNVAFTANGPNYRVRGLEIQATARPIDGFTLNTSMALNDSKQLNSPSLTGQKGVLPGGADVFGPAGGTLAQSPAFKTSMRARYEWADVRFSPYVQLALTHSSHSHSSAAGTLISLSPDFYKDNPIFNFFQEPITKVDVSAGISGDAWTATIYIDNITNERGQQFIGANEFVQSVVVDRPLTGGVKLSYKF